MVLGIPERAIERINRAVHGVFRLHSETTPSRQLFLGWIVLRGGDTDTNAAIAGVLLERVEATQVALRIIIGYQGHFCKYQGHFCKRQRHAASHLHSRAPMRGI